MHHNARADPGGHTGVAGIVEQAVAVLRTDPARAELLLRQALSRGAGLPATDLARLSSLVVTAVAARGGPDRELADAALAAALRWEAISPPDAAHHRALAARILHRQGQHAAAADLFATVLPARDLPYRPPEIALLHEQYGWSLRALGRYTDAAGQFEAGAGLVADGAEYRELHADLSADARTARLFTTGGPSTMNPR
ncbi:hypothetical protein [Nocardia stercoris]|uniref:Tetratricopeptide repeat protein n=1 Tax=Nocardia stercoris TaxID=2483361 RepID=A0A3M2L5I3_9NOCA|nr:hypothetical protein [Nocardia stercoris]RMI32861.1 hypothetical protein EBN03_13145 [Nocardia stercoris]